MVNIINDYIHEYDLDYANFFGRYKEEIIEEYKINSNLQNPNNVDVNLKNNNILHFILPKLYKIVQENYDVGPPLVEYGIRMYKQNSQDFKSNLHSHVHIMHSISAVFYLDIPKEGGEIYFSYMGNEKFNGFKLKVKPKINKVYLFPPWLPHTPLPHKDADVTRLSFNWGYGSNIKPIHRGTRCVW